MRILLSIYRVLLLIYPLDVRRSDGDEMRGLFADMLHAARETGGRPRMLFTAFRSLVEMPRSAWAAHRGPSRGASWIDLFLLDVRFAYRTFRTQPRFTILAIATLAIGIGATGAMFSVVNASLLRPLPFPEPNQLVSLYLTSQGPTQGFNRTPWSYLEYQAAERSTPAFAAIGAYSIQNFTVGGGVETGAQFPQQISGEVASSSYFDVVGITPNLGRTFSASEDDGVGSAPLVLLTHGFHQSFFGGDPSVLGQDLRVNGTLLTVIGIMPEGFRGLSGRADLWITQSTAPTIAYAGQLTSHQHFINVVARRLSETSPGELAGQMNALGATIDKEFVHEGDRTWGATYISLHEARINTSDRTAQILLFAAVGLVLLVAAGNLINLLLVRSKSRRRELAIRTAVGSSPRRIVAQLMTESVILSLLGGALGTLLAVVFSRALIRVSPQQLASSTNDFGQLSTFSEIQMTGTVFAFLLVLSIGTGLFVGAIPALKAGRTGLRDAMDRGRKVSWGGARISTVLVVGELGVTSGLLAGAFLLLASFANLTTRDLGVEGDDVLTIWLEPPPSRYTTEEAPAFLESVLASVGNIPGVESATVGRCTPLMGTCSRTQANGSRDALIADDSRQTRRHYVGENHLATLGIPLIRGRALSTQDRRETLRVTLVNQTGAAEFWPGEDPIGKAVWFQANDFNPDSAYYVVGVVGDVKYGAIEAPHSPDFYTPFRQFTWPHTFLMVRSSVDPEVLVPQLRAAIRLVDPEVPLHDIQTLDQRIGTALEQPRFGATVLGSFAAMALGLAGLGIYGLMAHSVAERSREIGIRLAVGAAPRRLRNAIMIDGMKLVAAGTALGLIFAMVVSRLLRASLYGVSPSDPRVFLTVAAVLGSTALLACYVPARRAASIDPTVILGAE